MKKLLSLLSLLSVALSSATNYYVNPSAANDNGAGTTPQTAFKFLQTAAQKTQPGDTVFIMPGTFFVPSNSNILEIYFSGTSTSPITYKAYDANNKPVISYGPTTNYGIAIFGAKHIIIDGIKIEGNNKNFYNFDRTALLSSLSTILANQGTSTRNIGIYIAPKNNDVTTFRPTNIVVRNCNISDCGGSGISTVKADNITIEKNTIFNCGWFSDALSGGISFYQQDNASTTTTVKNNIRRNTLYSNKSFFNPTQSGAAILINDGRHTELNNTNPKYVGKTLVSNNLVFNNGGRAVYVRKTDNVLVANNTFHKNCDQTELQTQAENYEVLGTDVASTKVFNNIVFSKTASNGIFYRSTVANDPANVNNTVEKNIIYWTNRANSQNFYANNPLFIDAANFNFKLNSLSPAINRGTATDAPTSDFDGTARVGLTDVGAYEYVASAREFATEEVYTPEVASYEVYPNPTATDLNIKFDDATVTQIAVMNQFGQTVITKNNVNGNQVNINVSDLPTGIYFVSVNGNQSQSKKFIKM